MAGQKTKQIFDFIRANGWEDAIQKFKPAGEPQSDDPSFGEFFQAIRDHSTMEKSTLEIYIGKCRTLIGEIFKIPKPASVHYAKSEAKQKWTRKVEGIQIRRLKAQHVQRWKKRRIDMASTPAANQRARATINSILRNSKSLFSSRIQRLLDEVFPNFPWSNPITECDFEKVRPQKYRSCLEENGGIELLIKAADRDLRPEVPELEIENLRESAEATRFAISKHQQYKILLLALGVGLRRKEIDTLRWQQLDFSNNRIRI